MSAARIARLTESDWEVFAGLRLRALLEAFGADDHQYLQEKLFTEAQWRRRINEHTQFAAWLSDRPVGLIGAYRQSAETIYLYSLWLDPDVRGHGVAHDLIAATLGWARGQRARTVYLQVAADNAVARSVYTSLGFTATGYDRNGQLAMAVTVG